MPYSIRRNLMLKELDIRTEVSGAQRVFSIAFIKNNGEKVFFPRAIATGLRMNVKENRMRGILPVDEKGEAADHVYPVGIDRIIEFNGMEIIL